MAKQTIRTDFLAKTVNLTNEFKEHMALIWSLTPNQRRSLLNAVIDMQRALTTGQTQAIKERALEA